MANDKTYDRHINIWINGKEVVNNISSIKSESIKATNELAKMTRGSQEYNDKALEVRKLKSILKEHQDSISATGGAWNKVKGLFSSAQGVFLAGLGFVTGAYQGLKSVIFSTDQLGDKFEKTIGGWKGGLDAFARSIATISEGGLKNLGKKIKEGIEEGRRYAESLDNIGEKTRALMIAEAKANNEILRQTEISKSAKYSKEEQVAAGKRVIEIEEQLTQIRQGIANEAYLNESKNIQNATHLTEDEILAYVQSRDQLVINLATNKEYIQSIADKIEKGKEYNEDVARYNKLYNDTITATGQYTIMTKEQAAEYVNLGKKIAGASEETKRFAIAQANMPGDDKMLLFAQKMVAYEDAIGSGLNNTMKIRTSTAKKEEQLEYESLKRKQDAIDLQILGDKLADEYFADEQKYNQKDLEDLKLMNDWTNEFFNNEHKRNQEELKDKELMEKWTDEYFKKETNRELTDLENEIIAKGNNVFAQIDLEKKKNEILRQEEIAAAEKTGASVQLINEKYAKLDRDLDDKKLQTKLQLASEFFANVATIAGKQTAIGKAAAIAETTINTYASATASYKALSGIPYVGPVLGAIAAAAAIVAGLANVRQIMKVNTSTKGYSIGGFTGPGDKNKPAGMVHAGEWVAPARMVSAPDTGAIIQALEYSRVNGSSSYANGGGPGMSSSGSGASGSTPALVASNPKLEATMDRMNRFLASLERNGVNMKFGYKEADNVQQGLDKLSDIRDKVTM
jgi:hypothetical protein